MKFQRSTLVKIFLGIVFVVFNIIWSLHANQTLIIICITISAVLYLFIFGNNYRVYENKISKYFFNLKYYEIDISEIQIVEFYSVRKAGQIRINIASPDEDEYRLLLNNGGIVNIPSYYMNGRMTIGEFIYKKYKVKKKETKKIKYIYGNP